MQAAHLFVDIKPLPGLAPPQDAGANLQAAIDPETGEGGRMGRYLLYAAPK